MKTTADHQKSLKSHWRRWNAMSDAKRYIAARANHDARPLTEADFARMQRTPQVKIIRRVLGLSQEEFALRYHIPIGTLRDWEQGQVVPDRVARAYLTVIACRPESVRKVLATARTFKPATASGHSSTWMVLTSV